MKKLIPLVLLLGLSAGAYAHGMSEADKQAMLEGGNLRYLWLGAVHMVTGYDHLLFLFGVIFYLAGIKDILKFVTAFTVGHSVTLIIATFAGITANYYLVDAVIALSVCYKAFDNLDGFRKYLGMQAPNLLVMILVFGLIHGFGLSTRLQQLPLPEVGLIFRILSFNVGVELGQVAALSVLVTLLAGWRRTGSFLKLGGFANFLLLLAGVGLFSYQITSYFRGDAHHDEETHGAHPPGEEGHSHDGDGHSHGPGGHDHGPGGHDPAQDTAVVPPGSYAPADSAGTHSHGAHGHDHAKPAHTHGAAGHTHPHELAAPDSSTVADSLKPAGTQGHSHGDPGHSHDHEAVPKPKRPPKKPHSHKEGVPHSH